MPQISHLRRLRNCLSATLAAATLIGTVPTVAIASSSHTRSAGAAHHALLHADPYARLKSASD